MGWDYISEYPKKNSWYLFGNLDVVFQYVHIDMEHPSGVYHFREKPRVFHVFNVTLQEVN